MASTVVTFPPELAVEAKMRDFNIISELELRALKAKSNISSLESIASSSSMLSTKSVSTIFGEEDSSSSSAMSSISDTTTPTPDVNSGFIYLQYYNNDY